MSKLIVALVLVAAVCTACDASGAAIAGISPTPTARPPSGSATASAPAAVATPAPIAVPPTATPAAPAPTAPPPPKPAPSVKAVPPRGVRGSTFVFQFSGFPTSQQGVDVVQTVTLPTGARLAAKTFLAKPDGTGFTTYTPLATDPAGQYVVQLQVAGGGVSSFAIITVD